MSHQVDKMFFVGETPWHGLGHYFEVAPRTMDEILPAAGLNWNVNSGKIFDANGKEIEGYQQLTRSDNNFSLGVMGKRYQAMQNNEALQSLMPLIESGEAEIETAGALDHGKKVWFLFRSNHLKETILANGERIRNFFLFSTSHDGSRANRMGRTSTRVVCANTLAVSDGDSAVKFRHTKGQVHVLDQLVTLATETNMENERMADAFNLLLSKRCTHAELRDYIQQVMGLSDSTRGQNILTDIAGKAYYGRGNSDVKGTWWAALNAVTEHLSHEIGQSAESRYKSLWFGANQGVLNKATTIAIKRAA